jgi:hypothetical protein
VYSDPISIPLPSGLPFSNDTESLVFVSSNGFLSFRTGHAYCCPGQFNSSSPYTHLVAPYWTPSDLSSRGQVLYEVHTNSSLLDTVNSAISSEIGVIFEGAWLLVVYWSDIPSATDTTQSNSYQAVVVTDGTRSFSLFLYRCGLLQSPGAGIGFSAAGNFFQNHRLSLSASSPDIACRPHSHWSSLLYPIHYDGTHSEAVIPRHRDVRRPFLYIPLAPRAHDTYVEGEERVTPIDARRPGRI